VEDTIRSIRTSDFDENWADNDVVMFSERGFSAIFVPGMAELSISASSLSVEILLLVRCTKSIFFSSIDQSSKILIIAARQITPFCTDLIIELGSSRFENTGCSKIILSIIRFEF